jgi:hypothetical protein
MERNHLEWFQLCRTSARKTNRRRSSRRAERGPGTRYSSNAQKESNKPASISGRVGSDYKTFTADEDNKIWRVNNPEALSGMRDVT